MNKIVGVFTVRMILGLIFLMQGFGKVVTWGMEKVIYADFFHETFKDLLPEFVIRATAYYTSYIEFLGGLLLVLGLKVDYAILDAEGRQIVPGGYVTITEDVRGSFRCTPDDYRRMVRMGANF